MPIKQYWHTRIFRPSDGPGHGTIYMQILKNSWVKSSNSRVSRPPCYLTLLFSSCDPGMSSICPCQILNFEYLLKIISTAPACRKQQQIFDIIQHVQIFEMLRSLTKKTCQMTTGNLQQARLILVSFSNPPVCIKIIKIA